MISNEADISGMAELEVVFLLFVIGLELSLPRLMTMRRLVFGLGGLQVLMTWIVIAALAPLFGNSAAASLLIGAGLTLSSTAIVVEQLAREQRLTTGSRCSRASCSTTMAVDDRARLAPISSEAADELPNSGAKAAMTIQVISTCRPPRPNTRRRMVIRRGRDNSRPNDEQQENNSELGRHRDVSLVADPRPGERGKSLRQQPSLPGPSSAPAAR